MDIFFILPRLVHTHCTLRPEDLRESLWYSLASSWPVLIFFTETGNLARVFRSTWKSVVAFGRSRYFVSLYWRYACFDHDYILLISNFLLACNTKVMLKPHPAGQRPYRSYLSPSVYIYKRLAPTQSAFINTIHSIGWTGRGCRSIFTR